MQGTSLIVLVVVMFAAMYFLMIRPQKKQMEKQKEMLSKAQPGARVMLSSGIFGTIRATGDKQLVIELAPGVDITVVKQAVTKVVSADEEEFEFADSDATSEDASPEDASPEDTGTEPSTEPATATPAAPSLFPLTENSPAVAPHDQAADDVPLTSDDSQPLAAAPDPGSDDPDGEARK